MGHMDGNIFFSPTINQSSYAPESVCMFITALFLLFVYMYVHILLLYYCFLLLLSYCIDANKDFTLDPVQYAPAVLMDIHTLC